MTKFQLAKLIQWVGSLDTRKRMQKLVFMLQKAGCPFEADYFLHRFGPYSQEVAQLTEELVKTEVLDEESSENAAGHQFGYKLSERGSKLLALFEKTTNGKEQQEKMARFEALAKQLSTHDLRELEVASTILYYYGSEQDWPKAKLQACRFKNVPTESKFIERVETLAKSLVS